MYVVVLYHFTFLWHCQHTLASLVSPFTLNKEFDLMCSSPHFHRDFAIPNMLGMPIHDGEMTIPHWLTMATHLVKLGVTPPFSGIPHLISLVIILYI